MMYRSWCPLVALAAVILLVSEGTVATQVGWILIISHPLVTFTAVVLLIAKSTVATKLGWGLIIGHPLTALAAVVLLTTKGTVIADMCRIISHCFPIKYEKNLLCFN
jgi:hypothetical protein